MAHDTDGGATDSPHADALGAREDELLAIRCQLGDREGFDQLIRRWNDPLWRYLRRMTGNDHDAEELAQDVWLRVIRGITRLRDTSSLRAWLFGIARRVAMDRLRDQYAAPRAADIADIDPPASESIDTRHDDLEALEDELLRLPAVERDVLTLFYLQELTLEQVADVLLVPVGTVKSRLFRARRLLRRELTQKGSPS